ncbi:hypothetical protein CKAH01_15599 [Colletotrichum kahawae]|uniref:F-box domain-containing protein n=1 Tax=Colletotrichum kahawae TaxID=34407 RepID=A0AAD9YFS4_COLKA|nr:hypothetical protein CKAH01_15599 [Colletotrichum kahawae]
MDNLPLEIIATISDHLEHADFTAFESVNKALRHATEQILACVIFDYDEDDCGWLDARYDRPRRRACLEYLIFYIKLPGVLNDHDNEAEFEYKASKNNKAFTDMMHPLIRILHSWEQGLERSVHLIIQATAPGIPDDYDQEAWHFHEVPDWMRDPRDVKHFPRRGQSLGFSRGTIQQIPSLGCIKTFTYQGYLLHPEALGSLLRSMPGLTKLRLCTDSRAEQTADSPMKYRDSLARALNATPFSSLGQFDLLCRLGKFSTAVVEKDCMTSPRNADHLSLALRRIYQPSSMENFNLGMEDHALGIEFFSSKPVLDTMDTETEVWPRLKQFAIEFGSMTIDGEPYYNDTCPHSSATYQLNKLNRGVRLNYLIGFSLKTYLT